MRHLIHVTRTASGNRELAVEGAATLVRYKALEREIPEELEETLERGEAVDHARDERWLESEVLHAGDPELAVALGFAIGACAKYAQRVGASIEALVELDASGLDEEQRAKVEWLLEGLRRVVGRDRVTVAEPAKLEEELRAAIARQQN
jgi:hypothetical protein